MGTPNLSLVPNNTEYSKEICANEVNTSHLDGEVVLKNKTAFQSLDAIEIALLRLSLKQKEIQFYLDELNLYYHD